MNNIQETLDSLKLKFSSGNDIMVERAMITRNEYYNILETIGEQKELINHIIQRLKDVGNANFIESILRAYNYEIEK